MSFSHLQLFASDLYAHTNSPLTPRGFEKPSPFNLRCFRVNQHHIYWHASVTMFKRVINPSRKGSLKRKNIFFFSSFRFLWWSRHSQLLAGVGNKNISIHLLIADYYSLKLSMVDVTENFWEQWRKEKLWLKRLTSAMLCLGEERI